MSCGVGHRHSLDPALLWLWCRLAAIAVICPLSWELPWAMGVALKRQKTKKIIIIIFITIMGIISYISPVIPASELKGIYGILLSLDLGLSPEDNL